MEPGVLSGYAYAVNSPTMMTDPLGLFATYDPKTGYPGVGPFFNPGNPDIIFTSPDFFDATSGGLRCQGGLPIVYVPRDLYDLPGWEKCGVIDCIKRHEENHIADLKRVHPRPCRRSPDDWVPGWSDVGGRGNKSRLARRASEINAYTAEIDCLQGKLKDPCRDPGCGDLLKDQIKNAEKRRSNEDLWGNPEGDPNEPQGAL